MDAERSSSRKTTSPRLVTTSKNKALNSDKINGAFGTQQQKHHHLRKQQESEDEEEKEDRPLLMNQQSSPQQNALQFDDRPPQNNENASSSSTSPHFSSQPSRKTSSVSPQSRRKAALRSSPVLFTMPSSTSTTGLLNDNTNAALPPTALNRRAKRPNSWLSQPLGCITARNLCWPTAAFWQSRKFHQWFILIFTFVCYASYHMSRKPISIVETILHADCSKYNQSRPDYVPLNDTTWCDWQPFDKDVYELYFAGLDYAFQFAYAIAMFFSGHLAERMNLRLFLCLGMLMSGVATAFFGLGQSFGIHALPYYIGVQIVAGVVQSSGWPAVVTLVGNWFGKARKGLIFGVWNSHTSIGNILGNSFAELFLPDSQPFKPWAWSFILPGAIIAALGVLVFLFVIPHPSDIGIRDDDEDDLIDESSHDSADSNNKPPISSTTVAIPVVSPNPTAPPRLKVTSAAASATPTTLPPSQQSHLYTTPPHNRNFLSTYGTETHLSALNTSASVDGDHHHHHHHQHHNRHHRRATHDGGLDDRNPAATLAVPPASARSSTAGSSGSHTHNDSDIERSDTPTNNNNAVASTATATDADQHSSAISFTEALRIPGVVEFSLCLFFAKCVSYTFLYWLPHFIKQMHPELSAGNLASVFDVGGIVGGIAAGLISDLSRMPASVSVLFLLLSMPALYGLDVMLELAAFPGSGWLIFILAAAGAAVNGPYALITTAVSAELGTHPCLHGNARAVATVTAIIDGTGSLGAALGPAMVGVLTKACGLSCVFQSLMVAQFMGVLLLVRLVYHEVRRWLRTRRQTAQRPHAADQRSSNNNNNNNNGAHIAND